MSNPSNVLRKVLQVDAITSAVSALVLSLGSAVLREPLGLPENFLLGAGLSLFPFAAFVAYAARKPALSRAQVWTIVVINALWVADSALVLLSGWLQPTALGYAVVIAQAVAVAVLMDLEFVGLRRTSQGEHVGEFSPSA